MGRKEGPTVKDGPGIKYTMYDINHPLARQVNSDLIKGTVPVYGRKAIHRLGVYAL